jgi:hypothetical protein
MIRKRFPGHRVARIFGWTAIATAWAAVGIKVAATGPVVEAPAPPAAPAETQTVATQATLPVMPDGGLVVIRYTPAPASPPAPAVVTRVVQQRVVVQQAPKPASSGS